MTSATPDLTGALTRPFPRSEDEPLRRRALQLLRMEINFISNPDFRDDGQLDDEVVNEALGQADTQTKLPAELPTHLHRMCESDLLTHEQETALFREMNHLKFRANLLRTRLDPDRIDPRMITTIGSLLARAETIRNHIINANIRLVMSIVKKYDSRQQSFDELLSDGILTLMHAVEKFDFDRGFRFSTYAYRSIVHGVYRSVASARSEQAQVTSDAEQWAFEQVDDQSSSSMSDQIWDNLRELTVSMLDQLDRRERFIIRSRYAMGFHRKVRTFQSLADKLGISKERVRQLEQRAVGKLKTMAGELDLDEIFGARLA